MFACESVDTAHPASRTPDLWYTLARAFMAPMQPAAALAFTSVLADDLEELLAEAGVDGAADDLAALRQHAAAFADPTVLLVEYSRLFLPPGALSTLNLTRFVDSGPLGPCMDALEHAYASHGLGPSDGLRDFPDHAARQIECLAVLSERDAEAAVDFAQLCLVGALPRLVAALSAQAPESPYTALARLAARAIAVFGASPSQPSEPNRRSTSARRRRDTSLGVWRHCDLCGKPFAREKEISIMAKALQAAGLPSEHLSRCPDCRDRAQGFFRRDIG